MRILLCADVSVSAVVTAVLTMLLCSVAIALAGMAAEEVEVIDVNLD